MSQKVTLQPVSDREDWDDTFELWDTETDTALDLNEVTAMTLVVWDPDDSRQMLSLSLGSGITIDDADAGLVSVHYAAASMEALEGKNYAFRLGMVNGGATKDLILGVLPVEYGGPS
jgi:hypothetical protein